MVLADGIVKVLAASKSTSVNPQFLKSQAAGLKAEEVVIARMQKENWHLLFQRARTYIGEIDLIFENKNKIALIEVKKLNDSWRAFERIELSQTQKLQLNFIFLSKRFPRYQFKAALCWVGQQNKVHFVEI